ncbi:MAG: hypothetical protein H6672_21575 [Anaerolineaceae bacterium]|nr:hypothetical protein [Anaerolineaceae bacterium]
MIESEMREVGVRYFVARAGGFAADCRWKGGSGQADKGKNRVFLPQFRFSLQLPRLRQGGWLAVSFQSTVFSVQ